MLTNPFDCDEYRETGRIDGIALRPEDYEAAEYLTRRKAAPKFWIVFITTRDGHSHGLFQTYGEAEARLLQVLSGVWDEPVTSLEDAENRQVMMDGEDEIYFNIIEAPLGLWAECV